jgi:hypothetical protein
VGLFEYGDGVFDGYTLFAPQQNTSTYLVDNCGNLVHEWESDLRPGSVVYLEENGYLYRAERLDIPGFASGGRGGRIKQMDWDGNTVWQYDLADDTQRQHHDIEVLPNGNVLAIVWIEKSAAEAIAVGRNPLFLGDVIWSEKIVELEPVGTNEANIVWEWDLWDHLVQDFDATKENFGVVAEHPELMDINYTGNVGPASNVDWAHFNAIDYNPELDQIMVSSRHFEEIWIIDHSTTTEEAAGHTGGNSGKGGDLLYRWGNPRVYDRGNDTAQRLFGQHDPNWVEEGPDAGKIIIFNNGVNRPNGNWSSVDLIEAPIDSDGQYILEGNSAYGPATAAWSYTATLPNAFYSINISGAQRMPNGNTVICEGNEGRIFEVKLDGSIVWEYINPVNNNGPIVQGGNPLGNSLFRAYRYGLNYPAFEGKDLTAMGPIELEPIANDCMLTNTEEAQLSDIKVFPNPVADHIYLQTDELMDVVVRLLDTRGQELTSAHWKGYQFEINMANLPAGMYFLQIGGSSFRKIIRVQ